jgi:hypothetical protein
MASLSRRVLLGLCVCFVALRPGRPRVAEPVPGDDKLVIVRGWILKQSDLQKLGL